MSVVENDAGRVGVEGASQGDPPPGRVGSDDDREAVLVGEHGEAVGQEFLALGEVGQRPGRSTVPFHVDDRTRLESGLDVGTRAGREHDVMGQQRVAGAAGVGEEGLYGVQR